MKSSGAWWAKETGNEMLRIRCAQYNGTYDRVYEKYKWANLPNHSFSVNKLVMLPVKASGYIKVIIAAQDIRTFAKISDS
jgi:hypothetical protein